MLRWLALSVGILVASCGARGGSMPGPPLAAAADVEAVAPVTLTNAEAEQVPDCPSEMVLVSGRYCPNVKQTCLRWTDPPGPYQDYRCAEYAPSVCVGDRVEEHFCIDREEYVKPGDELPLVHQSWTTAKSVCESRGARLCKESEWQFACEGEAMLPYPYGLTRDASACNIDQMNLGKPGAGLHDLRAPVSAYPRCMSPFGVHDMSGNVEEWATLDHGQAPQRSVMKGAWWLPGKNNCRAATLGHGEVYEGGQVGVRCCEDAAP